MNVTLRLDNPIRSVEFPSEQHHAPIFRWDISLPSPYIKSAKPSSFVSQLWVERKAHFLTPCVRFEHATLRFAS